MLSYIVCIWQVDTKKCVALYWARKCSYLNSYLKITVMKCCSVLLMWALTLWTFIYNLRNTLCYNDLTLCIHAFFWVKVWLVICCPSVLIYQVPKQLFVVWSLACSCNYLKQNWSFDADGCRTRLAFLFWEYLCRIPSSILWFCTLSVNKFSTF